MSVCTPTVFFPRQSYVDETDLPCDTCAGLDFEPVTPADPDAEPPVAEVPSAHTLLFRENAYYASRRFFKATAGRYPGCEEIIWRPDCIEWPCCPRSLGCLSCDDRDRVHLPIGPVRSAIVVEIAGEVLDSSKYVLEGHLLLRTDGELWPTDGNWKITYKHGIDVPPEVKPLIALYACELAKSCIPGSNCALRDGYRRASFNNVEYVLPDPMDYRKNVLTGFDPLDDWIALDRAGHARTRPRIAGRRPKGFRVR